MKKRPFNSRKFGPFPVFTMLFLSMVFWFADKGRASQCDPNVSIRITEAYSDSVSGTVTGIDPEEIRVIVFVRTDGWYPQPVADEGAYLEVDADGTFSTLVNPWNQISAFIIRNGFQAVIEPNQNAPFPLKVDCQNVLAIAAYPTLIFSGYEWAVKAGEQLGPGGNDFSSASENVWVDDQGRLHLKITKRDNRWYCAEVQLMDPLGYGDYLFQLASRVDLLDKNIVASPFLYRDTSHELDIEFSRWGVKNDQNAQFVVQPWDTPGNRDRFDLTLTDPLSTHRIDWWPPRVLYQSARGHHTSIPPEDKIHEWVYEGADIPSDDQDLLVHINLWLFNGTAPPDGLEPVIVIQSFSHDKLKYAILVLQVLAGLNPHGIDASFDINGNDRIDLAEAIYVLQNAVALR